jgi:signal transduction histidine kinase/ligand-binding sensor domain-containing protein
MRRLLLLVWCPCAFALNPELDVSQYAHTAWKIRDGFSKGVIDTIAQTPDGYLWLGTEFGLSRFDGVRNVPWQPPPDQSGPNQLNKDQHLPSSYIVKLLAARDGTLWIGTWNGLASWKAGKLRQYQELAGLVIMTLIEDHEGLIWAGAFGLPNGKLCAIQQGSVRCYGDDGRFGPGVFALSEDGKGNLWAGVRTGVWRWKPGPPKYIPLQDEAGDIRLAKGEDGALLIGRRGGIKRIVGARTEEYPLAGAGTLNDMLRDRDGGLWIATLTRGLVHVHQGRKDVFSQSDGLSSDAVLALFEDHEGNIWVATHNGLDRFRDFAIPTYSANQGLPNLPGAVLAARDGSVWLTSSDGLRRWNQGDVTLYRKRGSRSERAAEQGLVREISGSGLPNQPLGALFQDGRGRIWISTFSGVGYLENDRFISVPAVPGGFVDSIAEDKAGNLWFANQDGGLLRLSRANEVQQFSWATLGHNDYALALAADPAQGGIWLGFYNGGVAWFRDGQVRASYSAANGLAGGQVNHLRFDGKGALWIATEGGLSRLENGRFATLTSNDGLPCDAVQWTIEDDAQSVWLNMPCGLVRVARSELDGWAEAVDKASQTIHTTVFDSSDGVRSVGNPGTPTQHVAKSPDGRLWLTTVDGISVVDPRHLPSNKLPPPVHIETVKIKGKEHAPDEGLALSHSSNDLEIDYTALSFTNPDRVFFKYKLEGKDADWQDVGTRRQGYYASLPPKKYRFRVMASNNDGVWNEAGAAWNFTILPAFYQTLWFDALCVAAIAGILWVLHWLRLRQMAHQFNVRMEERVGERTRIARDLHDTLLQSFQGVLLKFHAVQYIIRSRPEEAEETLGRVIEQARKAIEEGRDAVQGLRSSTLVNNELGPAISTFGQTLAADQANGNAPELRVRVEGASRKLAPLVRDEIYRIAIEALRNAFRHSQARRIEVEIHYDRRRLQLRIRDDGKGIDPKILGEGRREGHHGLPGMQERAKLAGGKLTVWSKPDSGTEVELTVPASIAYAKSSVGHGVVALGQQ